MNTTAIGVGVIGRQVLVMGGRAAHSNSTTCPPTGERGMDHGRRSWTGPDPKGGGTPPLRTPKLSYGTMSYDQSQCVLLALCVCALGRGLTEKVLGLGQRRGGGPTPTPSEGGGGPPPPPYSPPNCGTPLGVTHWLVAAPVGWIQSHRPYWQQAAV